MDATINGNAFKSIHFDIWSAEDILKESVCEINNPKRTVQDGTFRNVKHSVRDARLGPLNRHTKCETCGTKNCDGHFGHIVLAEPMYHPKFTSQLIRWLRCVCRNCTRMLFKNEVVPDAKRVHWMSIISKGSNLHTKCPQCNIKPDRYSWCKKTFQVLRNGAMYHVDDVLDHLDMIDEAVLKRLGMSHPRNIVLTVFPVPPFSVRPPLLMGKDLIRGEDDLTYRLMQMLRMNIRVKKMREENRPPHVIKEAKYDLQECISSYIDDKKGMSSKTQDNKKYKSACERLCSKEGRVRGNLMGKRVDYTARSVITGDDAISMEEVGVPREIAAILTVPVKVTDYNKKQLNQLLRDNHTTVKFVQNPKGHRFDLNFANKDSITLQAGWTIDRQLQDGDIVLFNRQPTLHKGSFMAHNVKILEGRTFRLNLSCTSPYNADVSTTAVHSL